MRPAFYLNTSSVVFSSLLSGTPGSDGAEYKLTVVDDKISLGNVNRSMTVQGSKIMFPCSITGDNKDMVTKISVVMTDGEWSGSAGWSEGTEIKYWITPDITDGIGYFTLPDDYSIEWNTYIIAEAGNPGNETDLAAAPTELNLSRLFHSHNFTFRSEENRIIAECKNRGCGLSENRIELVLNPPKLKVSGGSESASACLTGLEEFNAETGLEVKEADIRYEGTRTTAYPKSSTAPAKGGTYRASLTVEGVTAVCDYAIDLSLRERAIIAMNNGWADVDDTLGLSKRKKKYGLKTDRDGTLTVVKGNKFQLFENKEKPVFAKNKAVKISKKGKVQAKKEIQAYALSYTDNENGKTIGLTLNVVEPRLQWEKKLKTVVKVGDSFDIPTTIPLNAEFGKIKNKNVVGDLVCQGEGSIGEDGRIHIKGTALKKGTVKIPFRVYGKKFTVQIKVKKK